MNSDYELEKPAKKRCFQARAVRLPDCSQCFHRKSFGKLAVSDRFFRLFCRAYNSISVLSNGYGVKYSMRPTKVCLSFAVAVSVLLLSTATHAQVSTANPYPNEFKQFKFYNRYLAPLRPYVSEKGEVVQHLGSDQGANVTGWRIAVYWVGDYKSNTVNGRLWKKDITGKLASLELIPTKPISMRNVRFPAAFSHSFGEVSEINVSCDVYTDQFGLQYWVYSEDSKVAREGDLMKVVYGPSDSLRKQVEGD
jgi:hypothetical protein